eukprot:972964-Pleurochrysis_carterae.AAC.1
MARNFCVLTAAAHSKRRHADRQCAQSDSGAGNKQSLRAFTLQLAITCGTGQGGRFAFLNALQCNAMEETLVLTCICAATSNQSKLEFCLLTLFYRMKMTAISFQLVVNKQNE